MLHPKSMIRVLNINTGNCIDCTIDRLVQEYSYLMKKVSENKDYDLYKISFKDDTNNKLILPLKITELYGWTDILEIVINKYKGINPSIPKWIEFKINDHQLIIDENSYILLYDKFNSIIGFHGEVKYNYNLCNVNQLLQLNSDNLIRSCQYVRRRNLKQIGDSDAEFLMINQIQQYSVMETTSYDIITKSGFFNINEFHMGSPESVLSSKLTGFK